MLPQSIKQFLETNEENSQKDNQTVTRTNTSESYPQFQGKWGVGTSIFGMPVMTVEKSNIIINDFITLIEALEEDVGRQLEKTEEIIHNGGHERIKKVELRDENREFFQEMIDYHMEELGGYGGDRVIAEARYSTWNDNSPIDLYGLPYDEPDDLPIPQGDRRDKVWLNVNCYRKAPESNRMRDIIDYFAQFEDVTEYTSPTPELVDH